jgi:inhibitor of KinA sporulation pathway (predicted exonuclease)
VPLDKIVVVDLEATCWRGYPPKGQTNQIIEIGVCLLDIKTHEITDSLGILVKPTRSKVSEFCTELTTITQEMLDEEGIPLKDACDLLFNEYNSKKRVWASFGDYDRRMLETDCKAHSIKYPFGKKHINVKILFALKEKLNKEMGMARGLRHLKIPLEGTHHRGVDDAYNTAKLLASCLS